MQKSCSPWFSLKNTPYIGACLNPVTVCKLSIDFCFYEGNQFIFFSVAQLRLDYCTEVGIEELANEGAQL